MNLAKSSVNNPVAANILMVALILLGVVALVRLPREFLPNIAFPMAIILTTQPGVSPEEMEKLVSIKIEDAIEDIDKIDYITSKSAEGQSVIFVRFEDVSDTDFKFILQDLRSAVDSVDDLPEEAEDPIVIEMATGEMVPVVFATLSGDLPERELKRIADDMKDRFFEIHNIAKVELEGLREREIWVEVDPERMYSYNFSLERVVNALKATNINVPAGTVDIGRSEYIVRTMGEYAKPDDLSNVIIQTDPSGHHVKVGSIARIRDTFEKPRTFSFLSGKPGITLNLSKKGEGNTIAIVDEVKEIVRQFKDTLPPGCDITLTNDSSIQIKDALGKLSLNAMLGMLMVITLLYLFLGGRNALFAALGLPVALLCTFVFMQLSGQSLNTSSLFALMMMVGIIVDDAIVIIENSYRYMQQGVKPKEAAIMGTMEVAPPVFTACLTTIAAFLPLMLLPDIMGKFLRVVPIVVCLSLAASLGEAFLILPAHISEWSSGKHASKRRHRLINRLRRVYARHLVMVLHRRYWFCGGVMALILVAITLVVSKVVDKDLFAGEEVSQFYINVRMPAGTNIYATNKTLSEIERRVMSLPKGELNAIVTSPGKMITQREWLFETSVGQIMVDLVDKEYRQRTMDEVISDVRSRLEDIPGIKSLDFSKLRAGPPTPRDVELKVQGKHFDVLQDIVGRIETNLSTIKGVYDVADDFRTGKKDIKIYIDEEKAAIYGLDVYQISMAIRNAYDGKVATIYREGDEEVDVVVKYQPQSVRSVENVEDLKIATANGELVPFRNFAAIKVEPGYTSIERYKQERAITVTASVDRKTNSLQRVDQSLKGYIKETLGLFPEYKVRFESVFEEFGRYQTVLIQLLLLGVFLIYFILGTQFKSYIQPIIILFTIPFAFLGAVVGIFLTGLFAASKPTFSIITLYGIIGLAGIAVNDAIVLVTFINNARAKGANRWRSIIQSGRFRLRPVILTSITTMCGVFPMMIGLGGKSEIWAPMASTIFFGLGCATFLTLFIIPCLYTIIVDDIRGWMLGRRTRPLSS
jgi:multidrug efflux pump subunit AcrB